MIIRSNVLTLSDDDEDLPLIGYDNNVTTTNITATNEDPVYTAVNLANVATHLPWKASGNTTDNYLTVQLDGLTTIDYVGIAAHNFGTVGNTVSIEGTVDPNSPYDSPGYSAIVQATLIDDDCPLIFQFVPGLYGAIRVRIQPGNLNAANPQAAVLYVGQLLTCQRSINLNRHIPINLGKKTEVVNGMSESGQFLGRIVRTQYTQSKAEFEWFEPAWYRANFDPFVRASKDTPFFWAWNPDEQPDDTGYAWLTEDAIPDVDPVTRRMAVTLNMRALSCP
jgi:hypothetical protein